MAFFPPIDPVGHPIRRDADARDVQERLSTAVLPSPALLAEAEWLGVDTFNPCSGGHTGSTWTLLGATICQRCGFPLDMSRCPHGCAMSFCPIGHDHIRDMIRSPQREGCPTAPWKMP